MRCSLLSYLACPACASELDVVGDGPGTDAQIEEGALKCRGCSTAYPVVRGVPRFPLGSQHGDRKGTLETQRTYDFTWRRVGRQEIEERWEKDSYHFVGLVPASLMRGRGKVGLDAGCGSGADLLRLAAGDAALVGFDVSDGVDVAYRMTKHLPNVHIVHGDLHLPPFRAGVFDFVYSFGVLHHLPDPPAGFASLAGLLKPGAPLVTYLYEDFADRSAVERLLLAAVRGIRRLTVRLPSRLLLAACWLLVPVVWLTCSLPAHALRRSFPALVGHIPFRHTRRWNVLAADLFDRFAPPYEWRFSRTRVIDLYRGAGLGDIDVRHYRGWVAWGFKPSR